MLMYSATHDAECYVQNHNAYCHYVKCHFVIMQSVVILSVVMLIAVALANGSKLTIKC
jgi:hypothetical protein